MSAVRYEQLDRIVTITIDRPEAMNAINAEVREGLSNALDRFREDDGAWVAVLTGAGGRAFSAGADLKEMSARRPRGASVNRRELVWKPLIAAIDGYCLAGGLELALTCDIRVASPQSKFGLTEVTRGIIAGGGGTQRLPRAVPLAIAMELLLTGRHVDADEALRYGLVNRVVPSEQVLPVALEIAAQIAANAPLAVRATKESALRGRDLDLSDGLRIEAELSRFVAGTRDAREGPKAFAEKRTPSFEGR